MTYSARPVAQALDLARCWLALHSSTLRVTSTTREKDEPTNNTEKRKHQKKQKVTEIINDMIRCAFCSFYKGATFSRLYCCYGIACL